MLAQRMLHKLYTVYNFNELQAMFVVSRIWNKLSRDMSLNCWIHTVLLGKNIPPEAARTDLEDCNGIVEEVEGMDVHLARSRA